MANICQNSLIYLFRPTKKSDAKCTLHQENQNWAVIGLQGLAPYYFEANAAVVFNDKNIGFRFETEYEPYLLKN